MSLFGIFSAEKAGRKEEELRFKITTVPKPNGFSIKGMAENKNPAIRDKSTGDSGRAAKSHSKEIS